MIEWPTSETDAASSSVHDAHRPWAIYLMFGLYGLQQGMLGPAMPFVRAELNFDLRAVGLHFAAYALGLASIRLPYRWLRHRRLPTGIGQISILSVVVASGLFAIARALPITLLAGALMGISGGLLITTGQAKLGARYRERAAARLVEAHVAAGLCVLGGALLISGSTSLGWSWRAAPIAVAVAALLLAALPFAAYRRDEPGVHAAHMSAPAPDTENFPRMLRFSLWALVILAITAEWGVGFWGAEYLKERVTGSAATAAALMTVYFGGTVCGRLASSYLLRVIQPLTLLVALTLGAVVAFAALHAMHSIGIAACVMAALGVCLGNFFPLILGAAIRTAPDASASLSARASQAVGIALLATPLLLGMLSQEIGIQASFATLIAYPLLMLPLLSILRAYAKADHRGTTNGGPVQ